VKWDRRAVLSLCHGGGVDEPLPSPTLPVGSRAEVFLGYLDYFRAQITAKTEGLSEDERRGSRLPSGWTPLELVKHLTFVEMRWLEWGFQGRHVDEPWGDQRDDRWCVTPDETTADLIASLQAQAVRSRTIVEDNDLTSVGQPGPRWDGAQPATLERILFHLLQEYARHLGHLDVVAELGGPAYCAALVAAGDDFALLARDEGAVIGHIVGRRYGPNELHPIITAETGKHLRLPRPSRAWRRGSTCGLLPRAGRRSRPRHRVGVCPKLAGSELLRSAGLRRQVGDPGPGS